MTRPKEKQKSNKQKKNIFFLFKIARCSHQSSLRNIMQETRDCPSKQFQQNKVELFFWYDPNDRSQYHLIGQRCIFFNMNHQSTIITILQQCTTHKSTER